MLEPGDKLAILALYAEYNRTIDAGDAAAWARTFVEGGACQHPTRTLSGPAELESFVTARAAKMATHPIDRQRHWNDAIAVDGAGERATGSCDLLVAGIERETGKASALALGSYADELVKVSSAWLFRQRTLRLA